MTSPIRSAPKPSADKAAWRRWAKRHRARLRSRERERLALRHLRASKLYRDAEHILSYLAFGSELDLSALHEDPGKHFYVTRTWESPERGLSLHRLAGGLESHPYGYLQPAAESPSISPQHIELALVPGLCFDVQGARLGYGLGYFDRLLAELPPEAPRIGVSFAGLIVDRLPQASFDQPMSHLLSEEGLRTTPWSR